MNYNEIKELRNKYANAIVNYYANEAGVDEYAFRRTVAYLHDKYFEYAVDWGYIASWLVADYNEADEEGYYFDYDERNLDMLGDRIMSCIEG